VKYIISDEVAEVQHEANPVRFGCALILEDHSSVGVLRPLIRILATHENEANGSCVVHRWRCNCPADTASEAFGIGESVPIHSAGL